MLKLVSKPSKLIDDPINDDGDEYALLERITKGDAKAFEAFYKLYYPRLYRFLLRITRQPEYIEELIQETLLLVWEQPERFNHDSKISTWIFGIAYHKSLKIMSKSAKHYHNVDVDEVYHFIDDPFANLAHNTEIQDLLNRALLCLSTDQRAVIELTFYHGLAYQEIGKIMGCPENTVKTRMFHARKKILAFVQAEN